MFDLLFIPAGSVFRDDLLEPRSGLLPDPKDFVQQQQDEDGASFPEAVQVYWTQIDSLMTEEARRNVSDLRVYRSESVQTIIRDLELALLDLRCTVECKDKVHALLLALRSEFHSTTAFTFVRVALRHMWYLCTQVTWSVDLDGVDEVRVHC